jgi:hypothetical protein
MMLSTSTGRQRPGLSVMVGFYRTCVIDGVLPSSPG